MKLLAIDTATEACSAALWVEGELKEIFQLAPRDHTRLILPMVERLLAQAGLHIRQLDAIAFGRGPGAFTGVRIATSVVQGIAFGADLPVVGVSTLAALAQGAYRQRGAQRVLCALDARLHEVYWAQYQIEQGVAVLQGAESLANPNNLALPTGSDWHAAGNGWTIYRDSLQRRFQAQLLDDSRSDYPHAHDVAILAVNAYAQGLAVPAEEAQPVYLRDKVVA